MTWVINKEVCLVGTGFCGYAAYKKLKEKNLSLIVVEGGQVQTPNSREEQQDYKSSVNKYISHYSKKNIKNRLEISLRDRQFTLGGSSDAWAGYIKPFEASTFINVFKDFEDQNWGKIRFDKYNQEILDLLNSPTEDFEPESIAKKVNSELPNLPRGLKYTAYAWAPSPKRLKSFWIKKLKTSKDDENDVISGYKLIDFNFQQDRLSGLIFKNKDGQLLMVRAKFFMFCMGGIENAKFTKKLLESRKNYPLKKTNLCNFQEHPHLYFLAGFNKGEKLLPKIIRSRTVVSPTIDKSFKDGQINISFQAWDGIGTPKATIMIEENKEKFGNLIKNIIKPLFNKVTRPYYDYLLVMRCEQTPNKNSFLKFEKNLTKLHWNLNNKDFSYYSDYLRRIASFLIINNYAKDFTLKDSSIKGEAIPSSLDGGAHHMGTVPYTLNNDLINEKFRLIDFDNTYVVGSSAFPTSGFENPTHAAMATALVASDDIIQRI